MRKEQKTVEIANLTERLEKAKALIFADYRGLKVSEVTELRAKLRKENSGLKVIKNRLVKKALKALGVTSLDTYFTGPTAIAWSDLDPVNQAKVMVEFAKTHDKLKLKGGYLDGAEIKAKDIDALSKMPSREVLLARALSSMMSPATNLAGVLAAIPRKVVYAINAIKEQKEKAA